MAWSNVYTQLSTIMTNNGFTENSEPITFESPRSTINERYSLSYNAISTVRDVNSTSQERLMISLDITIGYRLSASDEISSYNSLISNIETLINALENESNWNKPTSTILYIHFEDSNIEYADDRLTALATLNFEIYYDN